MLWGSRHELCHQTHQPAEQCRVNFSIIVEFVGDGGLILASYGCYFK